MNSVLDFIQSLQEMKKSQVKWAGHDLIEKSAALKNISKSIQVHAEELATQISAQENLPKDFVLQNQISASARIFSEVADCSIPEGLLPKPTGLISVLLPDIFSFRFLAERLAPALLAGNGIYILFSEKSAKGLEILQKILDPVLPVRMFQGGDELSEILAAHPGIQAVSFVGSPEKAEKVFQTVSTSWKKRQIVSGYHNAALLLGDADLAMAAKKLVESCFVGMGRLPWNVSTIYVTEAQLSAFQNEFIAALKAATFAPLAPETQVRLDQLSQQLRSEKAKVLFGGGPGQPLVVEDLSHCSVLQQDCLSAPVVLISPVKYAHEMVKWTNTSYYGMYAQIFGSQERVEKFASQLEVSRISANCWIESMKTLPMGLKQSFSGIPSLHPFGDFFSDQRKIDGLESKS